VRTRSGREPPEALEAPAIPAGAGPDSTVHRDAGPLARWLPAGRAAPFRAHVPGVNAIYEQRVRPTHDGARNWRRGGGFWLLYLLNPLGQAWTDHRLSASIAGTVLLVAFAWAYLFLVPTSDRWGGGDRHVTCFIRSLDGSPLDHSYRASS